MSHLHCDRCEMTEELFKSLSANETYCLKCLADYAEKYLLLKDDLQTSLGYWANKLEEEEYGPPSS